MQKLISVVIPVFNESASLVPLLAELDEEMGKIESCAAEYIFIDDGSADNSLETIRELANKDRRIRYISFSRNFGKEAATSAGLHAAKGDAAICIDSDGQHPPHIISSFVEKWEDGSDVVIGVRTANKKEGLIKRFGSVFFYKILGQLHSGDVVPGSTDFRLIDRKVLDEFRKLSERNRITRGLIDWLGYKRSYVNFEARARERGSASYSISKLFRLAMHSFVSQSTKPLKLTGSLGLVVMTLSFFALVISIVNTYVFDDPLGLSLTGTAISAMFVSFLMGIVLVCQGLLALYIESIHTETQNRPLYIITEQS